MRGHFVRVKRSDLELEDEGSQLFSLIKFCGRQMKGLQGLQGWPTARVSG
jgi:hypothetical protein